MKHEFIFCPNTDKSLEFGLPTDYSGSVTVASCSYHRSQGRAKPWDKETQDSFDAKDPNSVVLVHLDFPGANLDKDYSVKLGSLLTIKGFKESMVTDGVSWELKPGTTLITGNKSAEFVHKG